MVAEPLKAPSVILASGSAARTAMLTQAGVPFSVMRPIVDEAALKETMRAQGATPVDTATALAELKAAQVAPQAPHGSIIIASDQLLVCEGQWFDKPENRDDAERQLRQLRGRKHQLIASVIATRDSARIGQHASVANLWMRPISDAFLARYMDRAGEALSTSVGAYQLEGIGAQLFSRVEGDWFTIMGMPLLPVLQWLRDHGVIEG